MIQKRIIGLISITAVLGVNVAFCGQKTIERVEMMPNMPSPYKMRDWNKVARDYDALVFDFEKKGDHLPLIWWDPQPHDFKEPTFALPAFVGHYVKAQNKYDTITCLGAINGATLVGIDKSDQNGYNWVAMCQNYFSKGNGQNLYLNNAPGRTGGSFWYELFPNILFYRIYDSYRGTGEMDQHFIIVADRWYDACVAMGGNVDPWKVPDFGHTAFDFSSMKSVDNRMWKEAGSAAGIGWLEYMAYTKTGDKKYLNAAKWGMEYLDGIRKNPFYEILFPHGVYTAARMNAEAGTRYDVEKLINWCFDGSNWRNWGISAGRWGGIDCSGLSSSIHHGNNDIGYAFAMNTFNMANSLVPFVRYDERYARAIGKWMLNAANSMRLFYANGLPENQQTDFDWAKEYDPTSCIAYEGLRSKNESLRRIQSNYKTIYGKVKSGSVSDTLFTNQVYQVLEESEVDGVDRLEHIWQTDIPRGVECVINIAAKTSGSETFQISCASDPNGPYEHMVVIDSMGRKDGYSATFISKGERLYIKAEDENAKDGSNDLDRLLIDDVWIIAKQGNGPFASGDAKDNDWAATNFGLYGSSFVGIYGGIIQKTNIEGILQLDCLVTDYYHQPAYLTYLYYNPHPEAKTIEIDLGPEKKDLYDAVNNSYILKNVAGKASFTVLPDSAILLVVIPSKGRSSIKEGKLLVNDIIVDYNLE